MERKLATVLFVDLVDSTGLVTGMDPEVVRRRVNEFFETVSSCVEQHGGLVEKFAGDAVLAAFGVPQAHEDDALRAVRSALAMRESVVSLGLQARVGIEATRAVVDLLDPEQAEQVRSALSQVQVLYAKQAEEGGREPGEGGPEPTAQAGREQEDAEAAGRRSAARGPSKLWTPPGT